MKLNGPKRSVPKESIQKLRSRKKINNVYFLFEVFLIPSPQRRNLRGTVVANLKIVSKCLWSFYVGLGPTDYSTYEYKTRTNSNTSESMSRRHDVVELKSLKHTVA